MLGVEISDPWYPTSFQPASSATIRTIFGRELFSTFLSFEQPKMKITKLYRNIILSINFSYYYGND